MLEYGSPEYYEAIAELGAYGAAEEVKFQEQLRAAEYAETGGPSFWDTVSNALKVGATAVGTWSKATAERDRIKAERELAKYRIQMGMTGKGLGPTMGGMSWLTILAFGGVAIFALLVLKKGMF